MFPPIRTMEASTGKRIPQFIMNRAGKDTTITITTTTVPNAIMTAIDIIVAIVMMSTMNATVINFTTGEGVSKRVVVYPPKAFLRLAALLSPYLLTSITATQQDQSYPFYNRWTLHLLRVAALRPACWDQ